MRKFNYKGQIITASSKQEAIKVIASGRVSVRCYGKLKFYKNAQEAIDFFTEAVYGCDPRSHECKRYEYILSQLKSGKHFVDDENMNY